MSVWLVRAQNVQDEEACLSNGLMILGFQDVPNLGTARNMKEFQLFCQRVFTGKPAAAIERLAGQLWAFRARLKQDDLLLLPLRQRRAVAVGKVAGPYEHKAGLPGGTRHVRPVEWLGDPLRRSALDEDLLLALSTAAWVAPVRKRRIEARLQALVGAEPAETVAARPAPETEDALDEDYGLDVAENARDQVRLRISRRFPGHALAVLVDGILQAQEYSTHHAGTGPDGTVTLMAGRGALGFDAPRLCVQVRSAASPADDKAVKDFLATVKNSGAEGGLLVAWKGFQGSAVAEARRRFFEVRLWDDDDVVDAVTEHYERLSSSIQSALPLHKVWIPAPDRGEL